MIIWVIFLKSSNPVHNNLVPRVLRLFGQRGGARRDSGIMEFLIPENVGFRSLCACLRLKRKSNAPKWQSCWCFRAWRFYRALKVFEKAKVDSYMRSKELDFFPVRADQSNWIFYPVRASERWTWFDIATTHRQVNNLIISLLLFILINKKEPSLLLSQNCAADCVLNLCLNYRSLPSTVYVQMGFV